jgi:hypothetical protein
MATTGGYVDGNAITRDAGEALQPYRLVKLSSGEAVYADSGDTPIGATCETVPDGKQTKIVLLNKQGTIQLEAAGAISANATVYCKDNGEIDDVDAGSDVAVGIALEAATADGDIIEVLPKLA